MATSGGVDRTHGASTAQRVSFALLHLVSLGLAGWLAFAGPLPDPARGQAVFAVAVLYALRQLLALFVFLKRRITWSEALGLSVFLAVIEIGLVAAGGGLLGGAPRGAGWADAAALALVVAGTVLGTGSEFQRWLWKRDPAHAGHCYTGGMFAWSMHINYFGETLMFTGWALLTGRPWALLLPLFIALSFVFYHIPALDAYLAGRYGKEFEDWRARTARFVPFLY
ncbi:MAG: DUF1295 domain-containing protein [Alphaproteobacteria bacterium]|nr:MAG: DUF1295 domain-containing protein [Alphaproteobacteria bacterium]